MFDADRPIQNSNQDRLSRALFAKYLARCMLDHKNHESLVIGLNGGWGSGKTSIINLTVEELHNAANNMFEEEQPIILNFSAWSYSGQEQLIYSFYKRLASEMRQVPNLLNGPEIINLLEIYAAFFTNPTLHKDLKVKRDLFSKLTKPLFESTSPWEAGGDPILIKNEINRLLKLQRRKIIIIIDNISRMLPKEILQIFQIVKSMADYCNTIYLLSFDKRQVVEAINQIHPGEGESYVTKLVQLPFEVPCISQQDIDNLLLARMENLIPIIPDDAWNNTAWADIYSTTLRHFFHSTRDVTYFVNTVGFSYPRVKELVNPVDFFILTALEVFEPDVYHEMRDNKGLLTDLLENVYQLDLQQNAKESSRCDEIINLTKNNPPVLVKQVLMHLFPRVRKIYFPEDHFYHSEGISRKNKQICSPDIFDVYFRLSIGTGEISQSELQMLMLQASDEEIFTQNLLRLNQDWKTLKLLDWMDGNIANIVPYQNIPNIIAGLINCGDLFPEVEASLMQFDTPMRVHRICQQLLLALKSNEERFLYLKNAFEHANKSIFSIVNEVTMQNLQHLESEDTYLPLEHRDLTFDQLRNLQDHAVNKIKFWVRIGRLAEHPRLLPILRAWRAWGDEQEVRQFIEQIIREQRGLTSFLQATLAVPIKQTITKHNKSAKWGKALDNITFFLPVQVVVPQAVALFESDNFEKLKEEEQLAILIFLDLTQAKTTKIIPKTSA